MIKLGDLLNENTDRSTVDKFKNELKDGVLKMLGKTEKEIEGDTKINNPIVGAQYFRGSFNLYISNSFGGSGYELHLNYPTRYHSRKLDKDIDDLITKLTRKYKLQRDKLDVSVGSSNAVYKLGIV